MLSKHMIKQPVNLRVMSIKAEGSAGSHIKRSVKEALGIANVLNCTVELEFNGFTIIVVSGCKLDDLLNEYHLYCNRERS